MVHVIQFNGSNDKEGIILFSGTYQDVKDDFGIEYKENDKAFKQAIFEEYKPSEEDLYIMVCITQKEYEDYLSQREV